MSHEPNLKRLEEILEELLQLDVEAQQSRIQQIAGKEPDLARELERLISASDFGDLRTLAGTAAIESAASADERGRPSLSRYRVLQKIGEGGFGTVWLAESDPERNCGRGPEGGHGVGIGEDQEITLQWLSTM